MQIVKKIGSCILIVAIALQFIRPARNSNGQATADDIMLHFSVPGGVQDLLMISCYDCHSNNSRYPWYSNIQPVGLFLDNHIRKGKQELNFSEFGSYSVRRQQSKFKAIADQLRDDAMPLASYTSMHKSARLSKENKALIIGWATKAKDSLTINN